MLSRAKMCTNLRRYVSVCQDIILYYDAGPPGGTGDTGSPGEKGISGNTGIPGVPGRRGPIGVPGSFDFDVKLLQL